MASGLGKSVEDTAAGILTVASEHMVAAIKEITINEGVDPRDSLLLAGGGAAGLNIVPIAHELGCAQVVDSLRLRGHDVLVAAAAPRHPVPGDAHVRRVFRLVDEWNINAMGRAPEVSRRVRPPEVPFPAARRIVDFIKIAATTRQNIGAFDRAMG